MTQGCSIRDGKGCERPHPDLITIDEPSLSREDQSLSRFPPREGEGPERCVPGLLRAFLLEDKPLNLEGPLQEWNFLAGFRKAHPQIALNRLSSTTKLALREGCEHKLTLKLFL